MVRRLPLIAALLMLLVPSAANAATPAIPIPYAPTSPVYEGHPATPHPVRGVAPIPQNPFMAPNGRSEIHNDGWQTDAYRWGGPLGRNPQTASTLLQRDCGSITFDARGRIVSICIGASGPQVYMFDPANLATLATFSLPPRQDLPSNLFQDFTGGGYFYLDNRDRVIAGTTTKHIFVIAETPGPGFALVHDYDLSHILTSTEKITSALPDSHGLLWIVARRDGVVATLNFKTGAVHLVRLGSGALGEIENSFAVGTQGDVYIATNRKLYRFSARRNGVPHIAWQVTYPNSLQHKPGQVDDGTGTTPTVMPGGYVNITDNADPMDVVVYRTAVKLRRHQPRMVCRVPVFKRGAGSDENSIIVAGRSMIAENNYGYNDPTSITAGKLTVPGLVRVDIDGNGNGCHTIWMNATGRVPTAVTKLSLANGLVYTYTKDPGMSDPWYWTAIDFRTGKTVFKRLAGTGSVGYNNNYAGIALGPNGTAYVGVLGGMVMLRDGR